ncbi:unnamed protein product [Schistosoma margrebowiei]|uniref:Uncharacterized protein n=1 Tax=Schistosoma margrebowiei TaxID=48269 RepID=A0A183M8I7_9TREM|nr:unnamed protein product [Schistosoma margrebowiei]
MTLIESVKLGFIINGTNQSKTQWCHHLKKTKWHIVRDLKNSVNLKLLLLLDKNCYADNSLRSCNAFHEDLHKYGQRLSCGKFHSFNSRKFGNSLRFKCDDIGHIQSVCNANVHLTATNIKSCNSDSTKSSIYNDDSSLSTIAIYSVESHSSSELNETQNSCKTMVSNQSICQDSHVIVPNMAFPNDLHISYEIPCKSEKNMLSEHNYDRKSDVLLVDADFSNDSLLCNDILNKFHGNISEESNPDVISYITYLHNVFDFL